MIRYRAACLEIDLELNHLPMGHEVGAGPFFPSFMVDTFPYFKAGEICFYSTLGLQLADLVRGCWVSESMTCNLPVSWSPKLDGGISQRCCPW